MNRITGLTFLLLFTAIMITTPVLAAEQQAMGSHHGMKHHGDKSHGQMAKKKGRHFSPHWAKTLTDNQKIAVDRMHLELKRELSVLKAQAELAQQELNVYTISEKAKAATINVMIGKLLTVKKQIIEKRYAHIREMRKALTAEQRISYDMGVLSRHGIK